MNINFTDIYRKQGVCLIEKGNNVDWPYVDMQKRNNVHTFLCTEMVGEGGVFGCRDVFPSTIFSTAIFPIALFPTKHRHTIFPT